ncbi:MAG: CRISPR-associated protein Cas4 [Bacteroidales bacterium]|nr:CRISPR-associated protein Cas4 [Bacteroidales bacterium]
MKVNATLINLYNVCKRECWLHANGIRFEQTSDLVYDGKLIHETSYPQRSERFQEIEIEGIRLDYYDPVHRVVHEIKKSDKRENAHIEQLKYYLYILEKNGIVGVTGILEYPKLHHTQPVELTQNDRETLEQHLTTIHNIIEQDTCPPPLPITKCTSCSYYDFCWSGEEE